MQDFYKIDKLNFLTAGMPLATGKEGYPRAFEIIQELGLDVMAIVAVVEDRKKDMRFRKRTG